MFDEGFLREQILEGIVRDEVVMLPVLFTRTR
jgi:hypothetical protein